MNVKLKTATKILIIVCFIGLSLLLYPTVSNYWNSKHSTRAINTYIESIETIDEEQYKEIWNTAIEYNTCLLNRENAFSLTDDLKNQYYKNLDVSGTGVMGYIEIPKIDVSLPLYHGTSDRVLQHATGHIDWSSLPVGGKSTHCVVSGHRGLPSAKLFTDLDKLREGDTFMLYILDGVLTYEVDQIRTVEPMDVDSLQIENSKDYCTLVTCTPYGINTHRLLVRGHRVENVQTNSVHVVSEAVIIDELIVASVLAIPILFILVMAVMLKKPEKESARKKDSINAEV